MSRLRSRSWTVLSRGVLVGVVAHCALSGCQFFSPGGTSESKPRNSQSLLKPVKPEKNALQLDVLIIDRRADDPLLGPLLWQEIDQVGAVVPPEQREIVEQNGCQVGHVAAKPPMTLLQLLGQIPEIPGTTAGDANLPKPRVSGRTYSVSSGTDTEIQVSDLQPECDVAIANRDQTRQAHFERVRFVYRLKPIRLQDGWVRIEFLPEIHHGDMQLRPTPTDDLGWTYKSAQNVEACHPQKFAVTLNVGESAVVTATPPEGTLGDRFFRREENGERRQRLLFVRLVDMGQTIKPVGGGK